MGSPQINKKKANFKTQIQTAGTFGPSILCRKIPQ